jgi:localization factor PodJL
MTAGAPWSVKGIDPRAREVAKELAARSGMTLGEWLNRSILEGEAPPPAAGPATASRSMPEGRDPFDRPEGELRRLTEVLDRLADRLDGSEARTGAALSSLETTVRATLGRLEQAVAPPPPPPRQEPPRTDRYEGVLRALESALGRLASQMQEGEARTLDALQDFRVRLERTEARPPAPAAGMDQIAFRVGEIQDRTAAAMNTLREAFDGLDQRLSRLESSAGAGVEDRLREVSFRLGERLDAAREEMSRELAETSGRRISDLERAFAELSDKVARVEREASGLAAAHTATSPAAADETDRRPTEAAERISEILRSRLSLSDPEPAASIGRLGGAMDRIGDRSGAGGEPAPAGSDTRDLPADDGISRRIRQSEDRTARLLEEARLRLDAHFPPPRVQAPGPAAGREPAEGRILSLFDDDDAPAPPPAASDAGSRPGFGGDAAEGLGEDWPLDLLAEARAANARSAAEPQEPEAPSLPGFDLSPARPVLKPRRFAGPGLATLAVFCVSVSLVGFGALSLFEGKAGDAAGRGSARTEPGVLAAAPSQAQTVRAAVALAPTPAATAPAAQAALVRDAVKPDPVPAARAGLEARFRKASADLRAGQAGALPEIQALATAGHAPAMRLLSVLHEKGEAGVARDPGLARSWLRRAAETGDRVAMHGYGLELMNGANGPRDPAAAVGWIRRAAEAGLVGSQFNLGAVYERGMGVPQDLRQAFVWYSRAAESGDGEALVQVERLRPVLAAAASKSPEDVRLAQKALGRLGYYSGPEDGAVTPQLRTAIEAYQKDQKAPATGLLDEATLKRLAMLGR